MKLFVSEAMISRGFWTELYGSELEHEADQAAKSIIDFSNVILKEFPAATGSMSFTAIKSLWLLGKYFSPRTVIEIGTYIGRSTAALYLGSIDSIKNFYTCDASFDHWSADHLTSSGDIEYFGKTSSTEMLVDLSRRGVAPDIIFIDGRLQPEDISLIQRMRKENTVFILDDFEGLEKGVANGLALRNVFKELLVLVPPGEWEGFSKSHNLAIMLPPNLLAVTHQVPLPLGML